MNKKRIAFVLPSLNLGGAERVVSTLANELCNKYDIIIVTLYDGDSYYNLNKGIKHIKWANKSLNSKNIIEAIKNNIYLFKKLKKILREHDIDLTIGFTTTANILSIIASKNLNIPCIISERRNPNNDPPNRLWRFLRKTTYKKADYIVVQTQKNLEYFVKFSTKRKLLILPNPLSREFINKKKVCDNEENIILSVGRLDKNKAQDLLIKAFGNVNTDGWKLIFVGDGIEKQNYKDLTNSLGLNTKVSFVGNRTNVHDYYNSSKIFAFTSQSEGFPNVLIEAMYFELPCISTDCPSGPSEIINDGENGFLIPVNDQKALENKLTLLMSSEKVRKKIGKNAFVSIKKYETGNVVKEWDELIKKTL